MNMDIEVEKLFSIVAKKKAELVEETASIEKKWNTTCSITLPWKSTPINIQTASVDTLIEVMMFVNSHKQAANDLALDISIQGFASNDWLIDCKKRIAMIGNRQKQKELDAAEKKLNDLVSPEQRRKMELELLSKQLGV